MTPQAVSRLTPDQLLAILSDSDEPDSTPSGRDRRQAAQREILDAVCARFGLTPLHLAAQPISTTQKQVLEVRPDLRTVDENYLTSAVKSYGSST